MSSFTHVSAYGLTGPLRSLIESFQERRARTTADRSLAMRLQGVVQRDARWVTATNVFVNHGAVAVYGMVADAQKRDDLLNLIAGQPGVRRIVDHLQIGTESWALPTPPPPAPAAAEPTGPRAAAWSEDAWA